MLDVFCHYVANTFVLFEVEQQTWHSGNGVAAILFGQAFNLNRSDSPKNSMDANRLRPTDFTEGKFTNIQLDQLKRGSFGGHYMKHRHRFRGVLALLLSVAAACVSIAHSRSIIDRLDGIQRDLTEMKSKLDTSHDASQE